ncbi:MAG: hypothetical protein R3B36_00965 [Polyangiaceae bacterium]
MNATTFSKNLFATVALFGLLFALPVSADDCAVDDSGGSSSTSSSSANCPSGQRCQTCGETQCIGTPLGNTGGVIQRLPAGGYACCNAACQAQGFTAAANTMCPFNGQCTCVLE